MYGRPPPSGPRGPTSGYNHYPPQQPSSSGPRHAGLGSSSYNSPQPHQRPSNLPSTPSPYETPAQSGSGFGEGANAVGEKFSLFVGSIAEGIENGWLERILQVAGPILSFRRPSPPFAFVEYSDPESVLRCLSVVNGTVLKTQNGAEKALLVKADEKTRARLDEYEKTRVLSESTSDLTLQAQQDLSSIVSRIALGDSVPLPGSTSDPSSSSLPAAGKPESELTEAERLALHLKDLAPEDLPDSQRETTLSSIAAFRERSMKKQTERRELDRQIEERRQGMLQRKAQQQVRRPSGSVSTTMGTPTGPAAQQGVARLDPQSFNQPIGFVAQEGPSQAGQGAPEIDDARRERERAEQEYRQQEQIFKDRERRFEQRERGRIQALEREKMRERSIIDQEDRERTFMAERLATWDDEREAERGREAFYVDRVRWRAQRRAIRQREEDFDARDRALEAQRLAQIAQQSDSFLAQHADLFASSSDQPQSSDQPTASAVKVSFGGSAKPKEKETAPKRPTVLGMGEEEEEGRRKRELIPLSYSDDEDEKPKKEAGGGGGEKDKKLTRLTGREKEKRIMEIEDSIPREKEKLFGWDVKWSSLNDGIIKRRIAPFTTKCIVEYLGAEEVELLNAVLEHVRAHKPAQDLVDELEPVLDEESTELVTKIWKVLVTETELAHAGF
ncbi:Snu71p [Sporobolomyces salmoneus]|uniref:Snu71p n=1 Tax=Sporobolomyces salmoneus TaxID=183962 RepID=UPI00317C8DB6